MTRSIHVMAPEGHTGKSLVALGIIDALTRKLGSVGVFRPILPEGEHDRVVDALIAQPAVTVGYDETIGVPYGMVHADADEALATIIQRYGALAERHDAVAILGSDYSDVGASGEFALNARVAANLNAQVLVAVASRDRSPDNVVQLAHGALAEIRGQHATPIAVIATHVPEVSVSVYRHALADALPGLVLGVLPEHPLLAAPTFAVQVDAAGGRPPFGPQQRTNRESQSVLVAAMTLPNVLPRLEPESTVIVPGDRSEMIPGILLAHASGAFPQLTGMILTGGYAIPEHVSRLIRSLRRPPSCCGAAGPTSCCSATPPTSRTGRAGWASPSTAPMSCR